MLKGSLPWQGLEKSTSEKKALEMKMKCSIEELCSGFPAELGKYISYCRNLKFEETPSYSQLRNLFQEAFMKTSCINNFEYDWDAMKYDLNNNNIKNNCGSNESRFKDEKKCPQRNLSRIIDIKNLSSGIISPKKKEIHKEEQKSEINMHPKIAELPSKVLTARKNSFTICDKIQVIHKRKTSSQERVTDDHKKKFKYFLKNTQKESNVIKPANVKKCEIEDISCNFQQTEITERDYGGNIIYIIS